MPTPPIDPEFRGVARFLPRNVAHPRLLRFLGALESATTRLRSNPLVSVEQVGSTIVRVHRPQNGDGQRSPAILWLHGGGFIGGSPSQDDALCRRLA
ncbi:MAG: alpha/beta hydrolase, partial [bacterium]|nr:alpha/beta hydrolase [bacterium]